MSWDQLIQVGIMLAAFGGLMMPLHLANKAESKRQAITLEKIWMKLQSHDRRTRKMKKSSRVILRRLMTLEQERRQ